MPEYSQALRQAQIATPLGEDVLLLVRFSGEEAVSRLFRFNLELQSEQRDIDPLEVLRKPAGVQWLLGDGSVRYLHGHISRFSQGASDVNITTYWAELVPWTWLLSLRRDCRIFQKLSVPDIVTKVFQDAGFEDFDVQCGSRPPREFCVQYLESDWNFVQRLLEEEGIFYFFVHEEDKHTLVLADSNSHVPDCPPPTTVPMLSEADRQEDVVHSFQWENSVRIGAVTFRDYDHLQPSFTLDGHAPGEDGAEVYEYWPGRYTTREEGERIAKYRLEAEEALREQAKGRSTCRHLMAGHKFTLEQHTNARANQEYLITSVRHIWSSGDFRSGSDTASVEYSNEFTCLPMSVPFRPRRMTPKPLVQGSQTAVVVGPAGEEIYTDEHGRVKLHFHWDRLGKRDENSSCWIRVSHPWAGQGWGAVSIPRIGQEVIVDFLDGDPDQPIVTGRVYNAQNPPPFDMPGGSMISGIKSNSTPGGGGYNGIEMNDKKGEEKFNVHAQYDMNTTVENDETHTVVSGNREMTVQSGTNTETIKGDASLTVQAGARSVDVTGGDYSAVSSDAVKLHGKGAGVQVTGDAAGVTVTGTGGTGVGIDGTPNVAVTAAATASTKAPVVTIEGTANYSVKSPLVTINADSTGIFKSPIVDIGDGVVTIHGSAIVLSAGGGTIEVGAAGVTINGGSVNIAGGTVNVMGGLVKIN
jgi:type VI secretion system secreted protein VgrG